jgi:6-phosphogluconolactonase/glucosamine-6-phosphate isomerase/deaminase
MVGIKYVKISTPEPVVNFLVNRLEAELKAGRRVLWMIAGGSAIKVAVQVAKLLSSPVDRLTVTLTDERFGEVNHSNSNWVHLSEAGFSLPGAKLLPVLVGKNLDQTTEDYANNLAKELATSDYSLALAGMGSDGHIFGIMPGSPSVSSRKPVVGYSWNDYVRITPTASTIAKIDKIALFAVGAEKHHQLDRLKQDLSISEQPAQLLKRHKSAVIFNDHTGEPPKPGLLEL